MTARDQHQPASSRAIAVQVTVCFFLRDSKLHPSWVQAPVAGVGAGHDWCWRQGPAVEHGPAGCVAGLVVPRRLDQQPAGVAVPGLGDPALGAFVAAGVLGGHQPEVGADARAAQAVPVADLDREGEPGQGGDPAQAAQPSGDVGVNSLSAAIAAIAASSRSRRAVANCTAS